MAVRARRGASSHPDPMVAVAELNEQIGGDALDVVLFFCSPDYDLQILGRALKRTFPCPVVGCTSAGQIGLRGFQRNGIAAVGVSGGSLRPRPFLIRPLSAAYQQARAIGEAVQVGRRNGGAGERWLGLLLVDGLSKAEERIAASLYQELDAVPIIGGSAGDDLRFERTAVYHDGAFYSDAAVFTVFRGTAKFSAFKLQHFVPGPTQLVITEADPEQRVIREINGEPAAAAYAEAIGVSEDMLDARVFAQHPLLLQLGGDSYVRSIQRLNADGSLSCFCAIEDGLVVSIGSGVDPMKELESAFDEVRARIGEPSFVIGCDCILRRIELEQKGLDASVGAFFARNRVLGFSTYGEQFNGMHVNQTFTGLAIGAG